MHRFPGETVIRTALELAVRAPSVHNSQPWRFRVGNRSIQLRADPGRHLAATDPDGRDQLISCGAALHHLRVALTAAGWLPLTHRLPDPTDPDHLASVEPLPRNETHEHTLAGSIPRRRTDRRAYLPRPVPARFLAELTRAAGAEGVALRVIQPGPVRDRLLCAITDAEQSHRTNPAYVHELARWTGHRTTDGIPTANTPAATAFPVRQFSPSHLRTPAAEPRDDNAGTLLVLGTADDDHAAWVRAGEATSAVLLTATSMRLATCPLTQPLEIPATRNQVRTEILGGVLTPQMVLRVGWPPRQQHPTPRTARRPVTDVLDRTE